MKKVLATALFMGLVGVLSIGMVGCDSGAKDAKKAKAPEKEKAAEKGASETEVKFKEVSEHKVKKGEEATIKIELTEKAPADVSLAAKGKGEDKISGTGKVAKGETSGEVKVKTDAKLDAKTFDVEVTASGDKVKGMTTFKLKVE
jgi:hypothetical protein